MKTALISNPIKDAGFACAAKVAEYLLAKNAEVFSDKDGIFPGVKTLPLAVQQISGGAGSVSLTRAGAACAATLIMTAPTVIIYTVMQGKVIKTMEYSGIKE